MLISLSLECSVYTNLEDTSRGRLSELKGSPQCDANLTPGWYRFRGGTGKQMATSCVAIKHCGTLAPGWMNGSHPTVAEGATAVQVCFHWAMNCCHRPSTIRVRNCSGFYVYELKKPPQCSLRYCGNGGLSGKVNLISLSGRFLQRILLIIKSRQCLPGWFCIRIACEFSCLSSLFAAGVVSQKRLCQ